MKKILGYSLALSLLASMACKSQFESIRKTGDPDIILKGAFEYYEKEEYLKAQQLFEMVLSVIKGRTEAEKAAFDYAYTHYHLKQYLLAAYYFKNFSNTFTNSPFREEAAFMSAYSNYQLSPSFRLEQTNTVKAIEEFQSFVNLFPQSKRVEECNKLIDEMRGKMEQKAIAEGQLYYDLRHYQSAVISFDNMLKDYPESQEVEKVRYLIAKSAYLLGQNSVVDKQVERYENAIVRCDDFLEKYPKSKYTDEIKKLKRTSAEAKTEVEKRLKNTKV